MGFAERRRLISAATSRCSVSSSTSSRPRSVDERFLGSVTLGGAGNLCTDVGPDVSGACSGGVRSVDFGVGIIADSAAPRTPNQLSPRHLRLTFRSQSITLHCRPRHLTVPAAVPLGSRWPETPRGQRHYLPDAVGDWRSPQLTVRRRQPAPRAAKRLDPAARIAELTQASVHSPQR